MWRITNPGEWPSWSTLQEHSKKQLLFKVLNDRMFDSNKRGRPRKRSVQYFEYDLKTMRGSKWRRNVLEKDNWKFWGRLNGTLGLMMMRCRTFAAATECRWALENIYLLRNIYQTAFLQGQLFGTTSIKTLNWY